MLWIESSTLYDVPGDVLAMQVVQQLDEAVWRAFVDAHPRGNVFHTPDMFQVFARACDHRPELWAVTDDKSRVLALLSPVQITLLRGALRRFTMRSVAYGGALHHESAEGRAALRLLLKAYAERTGGQPLFTELRNLHELGQTHPLFEECGYAYDDHLNYLINLNRPIEAILAGIGARTRKQIRKGLRDRCVEIETITDQADLAVWYELLQKTYDYIRVPLAGRSLFEAAFDVLGPRGMVRFLAARVEGVMVACSIELCYKRTIYGWYGGSDRAYSRYIPNELLTWHILAWGAAHGYHVYDFGGAGKPGVKYGVRDFKAKFGGDLVNFGRYTCVHAPRLLKVSQVGYAIYRNRLATLSAIREALRGVIA